MYDISILFVASRSLKDLRFHKEWLNSCFYVEVFEQKCPNYRKFSKT